MDPKSIGGTVGGAGIELTGPAGAGGAGPFVDREGIENRGTRGVATGIPVLFFLTRL